MLSDSGSIDVHARPRGSGACSLCRDGLSGETRECPDCGAGYHTACLRELGSRCATLGCGQQLELPPQPVSPTTTPADLRPGSAVTTSSAMTPRQRVGVGVLLTLMGIGGIAGQIWITANDSWADPKPTWWQLVFSFTAFGLAQIGLGLYAFVSGMRRLREGDARERPGGSVNAGANPRGQSPGPNPSETWLEDLPGEVWRLPRDGGS